MFFLGTCVPSSLATAVSTGFSTHMEEAKPPPQWRKEWEASCRTWAILDSLWWSTIRFFCWWRSVVRTFSTSTSRKLGQFCRYSTNQYSFNHASCFCPGVTFYWYCIFICFIKSIAAVIVFIFCCCTFYKCKFTLLLKQKRTLCLFFKSVFIGTFYWKFWLIFLLIP